MECVRCHDQEKYGEPVLIHYAPHLRGDRFALKERWEKLYLCEECIRIMETPKNSPAVG